MHRSKLDVNQISQYEHDEVNSSKKVTIVNAELDMELNAADGDSIISKKQTQVIQVQNNDVLDLSMAEKVCLFGSNGGQLNLIIDNQEIVGYTLSKGVVTPICAVQVKVILTEPLVTSYLMVQ